MIMPRLHWRISDFPNTCDGGGVLDRAYNSRRYHFAHLEMSMNRTAAVNAAMEILKLRIQAGSHQSATTAQLLAELNALADGLEKIKDETRSSEGAFFPPKSEF